MNLLSKTIHVLAAIAIIATRASAQSGRIKDSAPAPVPIATSPQVSATPTADKITSIVVVGDVIHDFVQFKTTHLNKALKECVELMQAAPLPVPNAVKGGKLKFEAAMERAKNETDSHLLWMGFAVEGDTFGNLWVEYIDYAIISPKTAALLTHGRIKPGRPGVVGTGGILNLPVPDRKSGGLRQMERGVGSVVATIKRGGWF